MNASLLSTVVLLALPSGVRAVEWDHVVRAIGIVESRMLHSSVGDGGESLGAWQIGRSAWADVSKVRRAQKRKVYPWKTGAHDPPVAASYAKDFLAILNRRLSNDLRRPPTVRELYAAFNIGLKGFEARGFRLDSCPEVTRNGADRVALMCSETTRKQKP